MEKKELSALTDEQLIIEKNKLKKSKIIHATMIGFLAGILLFGFGAWSISPNKNLGFLIPMVIPIIMIYRMIKNSKGNNDLEEVLKERNLS